MATTPAVHKLRLYHRRLPWYIDIRSTHTSGITVSDVLDQLSKNLLTRIQAADFYNNVMNSVDREEINNAFNLRCNNDLEAVYEGVQKVDYLGTHCTFLGLERGRNGMWLIRTEPIYRDGELAEGPLHD